MKKISSMTKTFIILIIGFCLLPLLPNKTIDPWELFNPRNVGVLLMVISAMQFAGYVAIYLFGQNLGKAIHGFLGGFISSTVVFATLPHFLADKNHIWSTMASAILATAAVIIEIMIILFLASPLLFKHLAPSLITMMTISFVIAIFLLNFQQKNDIYLPVNNMTVDLFSILRSVLLIATILLLIGLTKRFLGTEEIFLISFLSGFFELHGVILAIGLLSAGNQLDLTTASFILGMALLASFITKFILLWMLTPRYFAFWTSIMLLIIMASGGVMYSL